MNINATLFVQIVHFGIGYLLLSKFFLRPIVSSIILSREEKKKLRDQVAATEQLIEQEKRERQKCWQESHLFFLSHRPVPIHKYSFKDPIPMKGLSVEKEHVQKEQVSFVAQKMYESIIRVRK